MLNNKTSFETAKEQVATAVQVTEIIKSEAAEINLRTVAKIKAKYNAYEKVHGNFQTYILFVSNKLANNEFADNTFKEMGVARLVANWIVVTELFLENNEGVLEDAEKKTRRGFVTESLKELPKDLKDEVIDALNEGKAELLERTAKHIQIALRTARDRKKK